MRVSRTLESHPKYKKSLPNGRQQGAIFGGAPRGKDFLWSYVVRISYALGEFPRFWRTSAGLQARQNTRTRTPKIKLHLIFFGGGAGVSAGF